MAATTQGIARGIVRSIEGDTIVLAVPGTDYRLHLVADANGSTLADAVGARVRGTIEGRALRIHAAAGGGRFIEPVYGPPRIVAGTVTEIDQANGRVLVDVGVPMWVTWQEGQDLSVLAPGSLVNFYVESGVSFTPEA